MSVPREERSLEHFPWLLCFAFMGATLWLWPKDSTKTAKSGQLKPVGEVTETSQSFCGFKSAAQSEPVTTPGQQAIAGEIALEAKGWVVPRHQILVSPKVSGMVMQLNVEEGKLVKKEERAGCPRKHRIHRRP